LLTQYPEYEQLDEVLFRLSECLIVTGRKPEAAPHLQQLIDKYPNSRFAPGAHELLEQVGAPPAASLK
jgi:outer membrane protein assembly factor BamD (BamD/ComL family)